MNEYTKQCPNSLIKTVYNKVKTLYVFGDIHGDYDLLIDMLKLSQTITINNNDIEWIGGDSVIVQIGDQIDSCRPESNRQCANIDNKKPEDLKVLNLMTYLGTLAEKANGMVISLLGNHEIMNVQGNLSYVSKDNITFHDQDFNTGKKIRKNLFKPGGQYAKILACSRQSCVIVGSHLFVHAGIINNLISYLEKNNITDLDKINLYIKLWLLGINPNIDLNTLLDDQTISPFWVRDLGMLESNLELDNTKCSNIKRTLEFYQINDIIIGHTPQSFMHNKDLNSTCGRKIWRVDNGSAYAFDHFDRELTQTGHSSENRRCQILKITNDNKYEIIYFEDKKIVSKQI
jgi:hypothetical protein